MMPPVTPRNGWVKVDEKRISEEEIEYLADGQVVFTRRRCPATNTKKNPGVRCSRGVADGYPTCWSHRAR